MRKRLLIFLLAVVLVTSLFPALSVGVSAQTQLKTSAEAVAILKKYEGFSAKPYWDYAQWTVGYGTKCPDDRLEYYKTHGITESEAESLLWVYIEKFENELYKFMNRTGVKLNQHQFDALLLFSYNCGSAWAYSGLLYDAVVSGATGNELIYAFSRWCNAGGQIKTSLLNRRLRDANLYLNGVYSTSNPQNFGYVLYDACGGTVSPNVQGYDITLTAAFVPKTPTYAGYKFEGWYTQPVGGTKVTKLDASTKNTRLYAHWADDDGKAPTQNTNTSVDVTVTGNAVNIRKGPGTNYASLGKVNAGKKLTITEVATGGSLKWGKFDGGWIALKYTDYDKVTAEQQKPTEPEQPAAPPKVTGTVKVSDQLRVRSGPSTGYSVVGYLKNGDKVEILEQKKAGSMTWGKISKGWISLSYVVLDQKQESQTPPATTPPATQPEKEPEPTSVTGTVKVNDRLRIRKGPGTSYAITGYLFSKDKVTITEQKKVGSTTWGKIARGWISMDYVVLDKQIETTQTVTKTVTADCLRIRSAAGTSNKIVGYLYEGAKVQILETKKVGSTTWGKIAKGWISMDYVK